MVTTNRLITPEYYSNCQHCVAKWQDALGPKGVIYGITCIVECSKEQCSELRNFKLIDEI